MLRLRVEDWGWLGLAARHGRVLNQLPGFAVPAATLWRPGVARHSRILIGRDTDWHTVLPVPFDIWWHFKWYRSANRGTARDNKLE